MKRCPGIFILSAMAAIAAGSASAQNSPAVEEVPEPFRTLLVEVQKRVAEFPLVPVGTESGRQKFVTVRLDEKPLVIGDDRFGCVRFVAPAEAGRDMVWAFSVPREWAHWYILPATGSMRGFRNWLSADRLYDGLPATLENPTRLQTLEAASFTPGATYVLWFHEKETPAGPVMLTAAINFLRPSEDQTEWNHETIEEGLGLQKASAAEQVKYLGSRGGRALLDARFFNPKYASGRIDDLLFAIRSWTFLPGGNFIEMRITIPPCETDPSLTEVQAAYGVGDFMLPAEQRRLFDKKTPAGEAIHYYDRVAFHVREKAAEPHIVRVTTQASDLSDCLPRRDGLTWGEVSMPEVSMRIFYRDRKEIARVAFWGEANARLVSGELPNDTFRRENKESGWHDELKHLGNGNWEYLASFGDGQVSNMATLQNHAYQGALHDFYPDGKPRTEANYEKGRLDGVFKQWRPNGEMRELHYRAGELIREGSSEPR